MIQIISYTPGVENYRGHCVAAIAETYHINYSKNKLIDALPNFISYDSYVGVISILNQNRMAEEKESNLHRMFS